MKKFIGIILVCVMIMSMTACANTRRFESESALLEHLNGMWVVDNNHNDKTYYIFQEGKIYNFNDVELSYRIEDYFDSFLSDDNLAELAKLDYDAAISGIGIENILGEADEDVIIQPQKGKIVIDEGASYEKNIIVTGETVSVKKANENEGTSLVKLSDVVDFSGEHFEGIFRETKEEYTIPISTLAYDANAYGNVLKTIHPEIKSWILYDKSDNTIIYTQNGSAKSGGTYMISDSMLMLSKGIATGNSGAPFVLMYDPVEGVVGQDYHLFISDKRGSSINELLNNVAPLLRGLPGALSVTELLGLFNREHSVSGGMRNFKTTVNDFSYQINQTTTGSTTLIYIGLPKTISLSSIVESTGNAESARTCSQCGKQAPDVTFSLSASICDICNNSQSGGNESHPTATQPPATQPPATQPPATQPPTVCSHSYAAATCTAPQTCTKCGATTGSAAGHAWKNATCTEPATCTTCHATHGDAKGHLWQEATCSAPKTCQTCKTTEGSALPHSMNYTKCFKCGHTDFSDYTLSSNTFCRDSWFYLGDGNGSHYLEDGEASINIDSNGVCKVAFDKYSYTFTLVQSEVDVYGLHFKCYMNGEHVKNAEVTFFFSQNRCDFFLYGGALGFSQVALNFDM